MKTMKVMGFGLTLMAAAVASATVAAAEQSGFTPGFYLSAGAGPTEFDYGGGVTLGGTGYSLGVGYEFNQYLLAEAQYVNYFDMTIGVENYSGSAITFRGLGRFPMSDSISLLGGGVYNDFSEEFSISGVTYGESSGAVTGATFGIEVALTETLTARLLSDSYSDGGIDTTMTHVGVVSRF